MKEEAKGKCACHKVTIINLGRTHTHEKVKDEHRKMGKIYCDGD